MSVEKTALSKPIDEAGWPVGSPIRAAHGGQPRDQGLVHCLPARRTAAMVSAVRLKCHGTIRFNVKFTLDEGVFQKTYGSSVEHDDTH